MGLFQNRSTQNLSQRVQLETQYRTARMNIFIMMIFTLVNMVLILFGNETYFLFSASIPYYLVTLGVVNCGRLSDEFYTKAGWEGEFYPVSFLAILVIIAVAILAVYLLCWIFSKKKPAWMISALVLFCVDTLGMFYLYGFNMSMIVDIIFHVWVLLYLIIGVAANAKLKKLPDDEPQPEPQTGGFSDVYNSTFGNQSPAQDTTGGEGNAQGEDDSQNESVANKETAGNESSDDNNDSTSNN